jgi:hypothetical protein
MTFASRYTLAAARCCAHPWQHMVLDTGTVLISLFPVKVAATSIYFWILPVIAIAGLVFGIRRRQDLVLAYQATSSGKGRMAQAQQARSSACGHTCFLQLGHTICCGHIFNTNTIKRMNVKNIFHQFIIIQETKFLQNYETKFKKNSSKIAFACE